MRVVEAPFRNRRLNKIDRAKEQYISKDFESLDYDLIENELLIKNEEAKGYKYYIKKNLMKWLMFMLIGLVTGIVASTVDILIAILCRRKFAFLLAYSARYEEHEDYYLIMFLWILLNCIPFSLGLLMVTYMEPVAAGSGIPLVKCYLNGIQVPRVTSLKTLFVKASGLIFSIVGGVASGKEGPMIHIGACVAHLIAMGNVSFFGKKLHAFRYFRDDTDMRDLVSAGAASGVSAAFGASVGGVLFSLEEGASFWNQSLTWRIFFGSVVSKFTVNLILSAFYGNPGKLAHPSLVNLGECEFSYEIFEIPGFMIMGIIGGALGALWNTINYNFSIIRMTCLKQKWMRVIEGLTVASITAVVAYVMTFYGHNCVDQNHSTMTFKTKLGCGSGNEDRVNVLAALWLQTPQASVNALLHESDHTYNMMALVAISISYYFLSNMAFGLSSSNGIFVPSMLTGAAWGRLICRAVSYHLPEFECLIPGKYALIGAAAQLGGVVRMTISLTVIIMETSDNIPFSLPIILTLLTAKMTGDFFNEGIYDINIKLRSAPFLFWEAPILTHGMKMDEVMNTPAVSFNMVEKVNYVVSILQSTTYSGFPVLDNDLDSSLSPRVGQIKGMILKSQLLMLLAHKMFRETKDHWEHLVTMEVFADWYAHRKDPRDIVLEGIEFDYTLDLRPYMNVSPYTLLHTASLPRAFRLFRAIGLRHLPIVNEGNEVMGMITRKDLAKFKLIRQTGHITLRTLTIK